MGVVEGYFIQDIYVITSNEKILGYHKKPFTRSFTKSHWKSWKAEVEK